MEKDRKLLKAGYALLIAATAVAFYCIYASTESSAPIPERLAEAVSAALLVIGFFCGLAVLFHLARRFEQKMSKRFVRLGLCLGLGAVGIGLWFWVWATDPGYSITPGGLICIATIQGSAESYRAYRTLKQHGLNPTMTTSLEGSSSMGYLYVPTNVMARARLLLAREAVVDWRHWHWPRGSEGNRE